MQPYGVVIPAYNAARTLAEALASVLGQSVPPAEVVVVDDGSSDNTATIAAGFAPRVRVLRQSNTGPGAATTRGVQEITSPILAFLDADDLWLPGKMQLQLQVLHDNHDLALVSCRMRQFRHGLPDDGTGEERGGLLRPCVVLRRAVFDAVGPVLDLPGNRGDMVDWFARLRAGGHRTMELDEVLALRRILPGSLSHGRAAGRDIGYLKVAHLALLRNRRAATDGEQG
ncbi:MAG: glycosyltransferase family A protein [Phaeovulum sp.]|uniref:glycosyltransferase family 2 protein n=1 Tax=Phaeovulum sp. TaxID=2934796 RepID=UPI0027359181|nr:glycosyltransferase family A protein [Phaeovulum sp.]MDP3861518.1 glycosyltransferase family A protein [Phaeovulum sp.]